MSGSSTQAVGHVHSSKGTDEKTMTGKPHNSFCGNISIRGFKKPKQSRTRWYLIIGLSIFIIAVAVVVVTLAVHFASKNEKEHLQDEGRVETIHLGPKDPSTTPAAELNEKNIKTNGVPSEDKTASSASIETQKTKPSTKVSKTSDRNTIAPSQSTRTRPSSLPTTVDRAKTDHAKSRPTAAIITEAPKGKISPTPHIWSTERSEPVSNVKETAEQSTRHATTPQYPSIPFLSIKSNDISLPYAEATLNVTCLAMYAKDWMDLKIYHQIGNTKSGLVAVTSDSAVPSVWVIDSNFTSEVSYKSDALAVTIRSVGVDCSYIGNFTCLLTLPNQTYRKTTQVKAIHTKPKLSFPASIVEGHNATITCSAEIKSKTGEIRWKFRPPGIHTYFDLSLTPTVNKTWTGCSLLIESTLSLIPQNHDNGSFFMCEVTSIEQKDQIPVSEAEFFVVPKTFCDDRTMYSVHTHPYETCNKVVYCFVDGPHVYQINCDPGSCYNKDRTECVPENSNTVTPSLSTSKNASEDTTPTPIKTSTMEASKDTLTTSQPTKTTNKLESDHSTTSLSKTSEVVGDIFNHASPQTSTTEVANTMNSTTLSFTRPPEETTTLIDVINPIIAGKVTHTNSTS